MYVRENNFTAETHSSCRTALYRITFFVKPGPDETHSSFRYYKIQSKILDPDSQPGNFNQLHNTATNCLSIVKFQVNSTERVKLKTIQNPKNSTTTENINLSCFLSHQQFQENAKM